MRKLLMTAAVVLSGCSLFQRSPQSGYGHDPAAAAQVSVTNAAPSQTLRHRVRTLESRLETHRERQQYSKILPWLTSDEEKIEFLSLPDLDQRHYWIQTKQIWKRAQAPDSSVRTMIEKGDISVGMPMDFVRKSWGEPQTVQVSGNPIYRNERWVYSRQVSSPEGYREEKRAVYFEGGRVVGWETE